MHKESFVINCNTLLHVSTLLGHLQGELLVYTKVALYSCVRYAVYCVLCCFWGREFSVVPVCTANRDHKNNRVHSQQHILTQL
jgi:hypothetical protein